jgi:hypothetical protein
MTDIYSTDPTFQYDPFKEDTLIGQLDPFIGTIQQTSRLRAFITVTVDGVDITSKIEPHLISCRILDKDVASECELEIDDRDGRLPIPPLLARVQVELGWRSEQMYKTFSGMIMDFEHGFGRKQGGRRMWVHANGANVLSSKLKEPVQDGLGEGAPPGKKEGDLHGLPDWLKQITKHAGVNAQINEAFDAFKQDYWAIANASPMHEVMNLGDKFGFVHQFHSGDQVDIEKRGQRGVSCIARWRDNLISWRVRPFAARAAFAGSKQQWYDTKKAGYNLLTQGFGQKEGPGSLAGSNTQNPAAAATESAAQQDNQGAQEASDSSYMGNGTIVMNGEPTARWNSMVHLMGARPGVDGLYLITQAEHVYSRTGYLTYLSVLPMYGAPGGANVGTAFGLPKPAPNQG